MVHFSGQKLCTHFLYVALTAIFTSKNLFHIEKDKKQQQQQCLLTTENLTYHLFTLMLNLTDFEWCVIYLNWLMKPNIHTDTQHISNRINMNTTKISKITQSLCPFWCYKLFCASHNDKLSIVSKMYGPQYTHPRPTWAYEPRIVCDRVNHMPVTRKDVMVCVCLVWSVYIDMYIYIYFAPALRNECSWTINNINGRKYDKQSYNYDENGLASTRTRSLVITNVNDY